MVGTRTRGVRGLSQAFSVFDRIPDALQPALGELLTEIGLEENAAQKAAVPSASGNLERGLSFEVLLEQLRVRIGLLRYKSGRNRYFYGLFVERGRRQQTVPVQRLVRGGRREFLRRVRAGSASARRKPGDLVVRYNLPVTALPARPFIHRGNADFERRVGRRVADFWSQVLDRAGAQA